MTIYEFRCDQGHRADQRFPMGSAPRSVVCPTCGADAPRRFTAPRLRSLEPAATRHMDRAQRSAEAPEVVRAVPPARGRPAPAPDPRHATLPRM